MISQADVIFFAERAEQGDASAIRTLRLLAADAGISGRVGGFIYGPGDVRIAHGWRAFASWLRLAGTAASRVALRRMADRSMTIDEAYEAAWAEHELVQNSEAVGYDVRTCDLAAGRELNIDRARLLAQATANNAAERAQYDATGFSALIDAVAKANPHTRTGQWLYFGALDLAHAEALDEHGDRLYGRVHRGSLMHGIACDADRLGMATSSNPRIAKTTCPDCLRVIAEAHAEALRDWRQTQRVDEIDDGTTVWRVGDRVRIDGPISEAGDVWRISSLNVRGDADRYAGLTLISRVGGLPLGETGTAVGLGSLRRVAAPGAPMPDEAYDRGTEFRPAPLPGARRSQPAPQVVRWDRGDLDATYGDRLRDAGDDLLMQLARGCRDQHEHEHPKHEDFYCLNLAAYAGERMAVVLSRLRTAELRAMRAEAALAELSAPV